ncbi:myo-inosose-2 dehydratase [Vineibacter terrae]|uniref:Myo-inosose-2 dehydratase n=1 Tax=Vineibacter terrae TaxID=2586908 RepID=A0A5C8PH25_9HYPH|nr:myo-inosose-2 dehydratase [Vineibacter terrae]TXL72811.1 myo-inosose-2 dehydratase [Vineibacter terrae]
MTIRLGVAPIAWSNDDLPELGGDTPLEVCLTESRAAGFSGTETGHKFPLDPARLGPLLAAHGLTLVSGWFSGRLLGGSVEAEKARMEQQLATFKALGAPVMVYAETTGSVQGQRRTPISRRPQLSAADFRAYGETLTVLAEHMAGRGVPMTYHHHMGTIVETDADIDLLMAHTGPAVGLLVDTGHIAYAGGDLLAITRRHARRINHVHCKDVRPDVLAQARASDLSFLEAVLAGVFTAPGDGGIDFAAFANLLAEIGYSGWVVVEAEQDPVKAPPLAYTRLGHDHLARLFSQAGITIAR